MEKHDFSQTVWSSRRHLSEWRERLGASQIELADAAGVAQTTISALERGAEPFTEPSKTKVWNAIARLNADFLQRQAFIQQAGAPDTSNPVALLYSDPLGQGVLYGALGSTPMERLRAEHQVLFERCKKLQTDMISWKEKAFERQGTINQLMDILNLETKKALTEETKQQKIDALGMQERATDAEALRAEIEQHGKRGKK